MVKYITTKSYASVSALFKAIVAAADWWTETTETSATVGGVTLTYDDTFLYVSGYGARILATMTPGGATTNNRIAVSDKGLMVCGGGSASSGIPTYCIAIGKDRGGAWGGVALFFNGSQAPTYAVPDMSAGTEPTIVPGTSSVNTQFIPAVPVGGNFVFDGVYRLIMSPNPGYVGKVDIAGTNFIQFGALALTYTE